MIIFIHTTECVVINRQIYSNKQMLSVQSLLYVIAEFSVVLQQAQLVESDIDKALSSFEKNFKVPSSVLEARYVWYQPISAVNCSWFWWLYVSIDALTFLCRLHFDELQPFLMLFSFSELALWRHFYESYLDRWFLCGISSSSSSRFTGSNVLVLVVMVVMIIIITIIIWIDFLWNCLY